MKYLALIALLFPAHATPEHIPESWNVRQIKLCNVDSSKCTNRGLIAVCDAISNIEAEIDAKIEYVERNK